MDILTKIEEIRRQPEHIRLRWVWGLTAVFTSGIILLWLILLKGQTADFSQGLQSDNPNLSTEFDQQKKSIKDVVGQMNSAVDSASQQTVPASNNGSTSSGEGFNAGSDPNPKATSTADPSSN
ncbi:MAG: hypothetical protein WC022_04495 [Parcubacteria group bacterium]